MHGIRIKETPKIISSLVQESIETCTSSFQVLHHLYHFPTLRYQYIRKQLLSSTLALLTRYLMTHGFKLMSWVMLGCCTSGKFKALSICAGVVHQCSMPRRTLTNIIIRIHATIITWWMNSSTIAKNGTKRIIAIARPRFWNMNWNQEVKEPWGDHVLWSHRKRKGSI